MLVESGRIADLALLVLVLEAVALAVLGGLAGRGPGLARALPFLVAGGCLLLAWRTAAAGLAWPVPALLLALAGLAQLIDLSRR